jgi:TonB family protein
MKQPSAAFHILFLASLYLTASCVAENKQREGEALVARANLISNIRATGAPPFRLKVIFQGSEDGSSVSEGTYTETWVSQGQWRRETVFGLFHRAEVGGRVKRWILDSNKVIPATVARAQQDLVVVYPGELRVTAVEDQDVQGIAARCVKSKPKKSEATQGLCFDKTTGVLLKKTVPRPGPGWWVDYSCYYADFQKFGDRVFPRQIRCTEDGLLKLEARVVELVPGTALDASLFAPLAGAQELANCQGKLMAPQPLETPDPKYPEGRARRDMVVLYIVIGVDGRAHDIKAVQPQGDAFESSAIAAVSTWRFKPSTCEGEPVPAQVNVEMRFWKP